MPKIRKTTTTGKQHGKFFITHDDLDAIEEFATAQPKGWEVTGRFCPEWGVCAVLSCQDNSRNAPQFLIGRGIRRAMVSVATWSTATAVPTFASYCCMAHALFGIEMELNQSRVDPQGRAGARHRPRR